VERLTHLVKESVKEVGINMNSYLILDRSNII